MDFTSQLLTLAERYRAATEAPVGRVSLHALGDRRLLPGLIDGALTVTLRRADRALQWFSDHWPASAAWPEGVPRPSSSLPSVPEGRAPDESQSDHPRGSEGPCPEAGSPASGPFIRELEAAP